MVTVLVRDSIAPFAILTIRHLSLILGLISLMEVNPMGKGRTPLLTNKDIPRVKQALREGGTSEKAAKMLGMSAKTIYRFCLKHNLEVERGVTRIKRRMVA
jgi:hypothetical protein